MPWFRRRKPQDPAKAETTLISAYNDDAISHEIEFSDSAWASRYEDMRLRIANAWNRTTHDTEKLMLLRDCLRSGKDGRDRWNGMRKNSAYGLEAIGQPLTVTLENNVKVALEPPNLWLADLRGLDLSGYDLSGAFLSGARLQDACLNGADLSGAHLIVTDLRNSELQGANLSRANLLDADLGNANLSNSLLSCALLVRTNINNAILSGANIHGISVWGTKGTPIQQHDLTITTVNEPLITVDDIEVGQFIYLMLHNQKIRNVLEAITSKVVLILGRFTDERLAVLNSLRVELRKMNYSPVLCDFDSASSLDITDTVTLLARLARFVIADLTDPRCVQQELSLIAPQTMVAICPIILKGQQPWAMFKDLQRRSPGLMAVQEYSSPSELLRNLKENVVGPAEERRKKLMPHHG